MKLVKEHINFKKHIDPKAALGVGLIDLIKQWLNKYGVQKYVINDDLTIDVNGSVDLSNKNISTIPDYIKFNKVNGWFDCSNNKLTSLEFCPEEVSKSFFCYTNKLTSLDGCPKFVVKNFYCDDNAVKFTEEDVLSRCKIKDAQIIMV